MRAWCCDEYRDQSILPYPAMQYIFFRTNIYLKRQNQAEHWTVYDRESVRWADLSVRLVVKANSLSARNTDIVDPLYSISNLGLKINYRDRSLDGYHAQQWPQKWNWMNKSRCLWCGQCRAQQKSIKLFEINIYDKNVLLRYYIIINFVWIIKNAITKRSCVLLRLFRDIYYE